MSADLEVAPLSSRVPDLSRVPLGKMEEYPGELGKALERALPKPEATNIPVAAFNSSLTIALAAMTLLVLRRPGRSSS